MSRICSLEPLNCKHFLFSVDIKLNTIFQRGCIKLEVYFKIDVYLNIIYRIGLFLGNLNFIIEKNYVDRSKIFIPDTYSQMLTKAFGYPL